MNGLLPSLVLALQAVTPADNLPNEIEFTNAREHGWQVVATTFVETWALDPPRRYPVVQNVRCEVRGDGLTVALDREGRFAVNILRIWDGGRRSFSELNIRTLRVGRTTYQARQGGTSRPRYFADVQYSTPDGSIVIPERGYLALQRAGEGPWLHVDSLLPDLLQAASLRVTYRYRPGNEGDRWVLGHHMIALEGLAEAIERCQAELISDRALRLHQRSPSR
jgi:hypothetical protein